MDETQFTDIQKKAQAMLEQAQANKVYSVQEVCKILHISERTVIRMIETQQIEGFRTGRMYRIKASSVDKLVN